MEILKEILLGALGIIAIIKCGMPAVIATFTAIVLIAIIREA